MTLRQSHLIAPAVAIAAWAAVASPQGQPRPRWIATWTSSTAAVPPRNILTVVKRTIRQVVLVSVGGSPVRIRLSNEWGEYPLSIATAQIALSDTGSAVVSGSTRAITFGGSKSIVIRPGGIVLSDPIAIEIPALALLAVSLYVPDTAFVSTFGIAGRQLSYTSTPGDHTGSTALPVESVRAGWMFLAGVDVVNNGARGLIVAFGSSITGGGTATETGSRWPDVLARRLLTTPNGTPLAVVAATINGNRLLGGGRGQSSLARFDRDVLGQSGVTHVVISEGLNDIGFSRTEGREIVTTADIILGLTQLADRARERGLVVFGGTLTPSEGSAYGAPARNYGAAEEAMRVAVNAWIRSTKVFDGVIDFDACVRDPAQPTRLMPRYDFGDRLHLNDAGYRALGECIDLGLFQGNQRR